MLRRLLAHPLTRGLALDDPRTTELRRRIIREKPFLRALYDEWYALLRAELPGGRVLELGAGGGDFHPSIRTEVFLLPGIDAVLDARALPFRDASLEAIAMVDVLHHIPDVAAFFRDAVRALKPGGRIVMIEPWVTLWSRFIYGRFHHEPFAPDANTWTFPSSGPLSGANGALPWIVFERDRAIFERDFPELRIAKIAPMMPLRYLLSGGVSMRALVPAFTFAPLRALDRLLARRAAMFALIVLDCPRRR
jgi:SAM-dependent methyltransferase